MVNVECNMPETDMAAFLGEFDGTLDADEERQIRGLFPQYLFFHNEYGDDTGLFDASTPVRICHCTACGRSFEAIRGNYARGKMHHERLNCPECGALLEGIAAHKYKYSMTSLESWIKAAKLRVQPDGALLIEAGNARRCFTWDELDGVIDWYPVKRYYISRGTVQMWHKPEAQWEHCRPGRTEWLPTKTAGEPFAPNNMGYCNYNGSYALIGFERIYQSDSFKYCQIEDFYRYEYAAELAENKPARWMIRYLAQYAMHPQIEMAVKFGLNDAVRELIEDGRKNARLLDWNAERPADFLRMTKQDAKLFLRTEGSFMELKLWKETAPKMSIREFWKLAGTVGRENLPTLRLCAKKANVEIQKAAHYLDSLIPQCRHLATATPGQILGIWNDYLDMAGRLEYDLREETVAMPRDLQERHDAAANMLRVNGDAAEQKRYKKRRKLLEKRFAFDMNGMSILIPTSGREIIEEGKMLHHCVGGYAARHVEGKTTILFLRKTRKPARSYLTIEMNEIRGRFEIRQIHGYRNENVTPRPCDPREKFAWFLDAWLAWVNEGSRRERDGTPILPAGKEKTA